MRRLMLLAALFPAMANAQALKKIKETKTVTIAYRTDALPFAYDSNGAPAGYSVDLCKRVAASIEQQTKLQLTVKWLPVNVTNRLDAIKKGQADMECGTTTATLGRMDEVDFSNPTWVDVTGLLVPKTLNGRSIGSLAGKTIAAVANTPNHKALEDALKKGLVSAKVVTAKSYEEAIALLEGGKADALAAGKTMLMGMGNKVKDATLYEMLPDDIGYIPYAITLPLGASDLRLAVNRALSQIYDSDAIGEIFRASFGPAAKPSVALMIMYKLNTYPEN